MVRGQAGAQAPGILGTPSGYPRLNLKGSSTQKWKLRFGAPSLELNSDPLIPMTFLLLLPAS